MYTYIKILFIYLFICIDNKNKEYIPTEHTKTDLEIHAYQIINEYIRRLIMKFHLFDTKYLFLT